MNFKPSRLAVPASTVIIGAGIGGLTAAALLLQAGHRVTVLESQTYPGGSAGTFFHRGFRFDAGATLAGGFSPGGPHARLAKQLDLVWPVKPVDPAWVTHLPDCTITQWSNPQRWREERIRVFPQAESFWQRQEQLADLAWGISSRSFPWPPGSADELWRLANAMRISLYKGAPYVFRSVADLAHHQLPRDFFTFIDAQLLISAQTTARFTNALYGSAALDLPRRGVNHIHGGIGSLANTLLNWIRSHGGKVLFRQLVTKIQVKNGKAVGVVTNKQTVFACDNLVANVTPWALSDLLGEAAPAHLQRETKQRLPTWGAFTLYLGLDKHHIPANVPCHHQVIVNSGLPLGEGNSIFLSLSDPEDNSRAPTGMRCATLSTHTAVGPWWKSASLDSQLYAARKAEYSERVLTAAEQAIPGLRSAVRLCMPGTPLTFQFYTRRPQGMVGGFPQTSLLKSRGPWTGIKNLWLVGDSVFPGQSTAGATLSGWRVAEAVLHTRIS